MENVKKFRKIKQSEKIFKKIKKNQFFLMYKNRKILKLF